MNIFGAIALITIPMTIAIDIFKNKKASLAELVAYKLIVMLYIIDKISG